MQELLMLSTPSYLDYYRRTICHNHELLRPSYKSYMREKGMVWMVRHVISDYNKIVRCPTVGHPVALYKIKVPGAVHIDSPAGRKMIRRICYF